jgi:hypothetical protein
MTEKYGTINAIMFFLRLLLIFGFGLLVSCSSDNVAGGSEAGNTDVIAGAAEYPDGRTVTGAQVLILSSGFLRDTSNLGQYSSLEAVIVYTDGEGRYFTDSLEEGYYSIEVNDRQGNAAFIDSVEVPESFDTLYLAPALLKPVATVRGTIAQEGQVNYNAYVQVYGLDRVAGVDPATGEYVLSDVPEGDYTMRAAPAYESMDARELEVQVEGGASVNMDDIELRENYQVWEHSARVSINTSASGAGIESDITGFPLLIRISSSSVSPSLFDQAQSDGSDIRFAGRDGTHLPYQITSWDASLGQAEIWVGIDTVFGDDSGQYISLYWGNSGAEPQANSAAVFDTSLGFTGVWHLDEDGNTGTDGYADATGNRAHARGVNMTPASDVSGIIGRSQDFEFDDQQYLRVSAEEPFDFTSSMTVSAWITIEDFDTSWQVIISKGSGAWGLTRSRDGNGLVYFHSGVAGYEDSVFYGVNLSDGYWHYVTALFTGSQTAIYIDGELAVTGDRSGTISNNEFPLLIGNNYSYPYLYWDGRIDEVRASRVARSSDWIRLCFINQLPDSDVVRIE